MQWLRSFIIAHRRLRHEPEQAPGADAAKALASQRYEELCLIHEQLPPMRPEVLWAAVSLVEAKRAWR